MKVAVGICVYGDVPGLTAISYASMCLEGAAAQIVTDHIPVWGAYVDHARNTICKEFADTATDADALLFVDQDMFFPPNFIADMTALMDAGDCAVLGATYYGRAHPHDLVSFHLDPFRQMTERVEGTERVDGVGMGATLIRRDVLDKLAVEHGTGWFTRIPGCGEDVSFAMRCRDAGIPVFLTGEIECKHATYNLIGREHFDAAREAAPDAG